MFGNGIENEALKILKNKKNLRIIDSSFLNKMNLNQISSNINSYLLQTPDDFSFLKSNFKVVSKIKPSTKTLKNLLFAFNICRFVRSNAIVLTNSDRTIGIGAGQSSRLDSCEIAINKMKKFYKEKEGDEIIAASDAFFPFVDGIEKLVQSGVSAIIQPSGSIRDKEIIKFANRTNTILVFSKTRHFKH
jgi:AICAR transformylase/IMP cyclohydrolase PurH (only IMP cyclohydrolase domain in Aful)